VWLCVGDREDRRRPCLGTWCGSARIVASCDCERTQTTQAERASEAAPPGRRSWGPDVMFRMACRRAVDRPAPPSIRTCARVLSSSPVCASICTASRAPRPSSRPLHYTCSSLVACVATGQWIDTTQNRETYITNASLCTSSMHRACAGTARDTLRARSVCLCVYSPCLLLRAVDR